MNLLAVVSRKIKPVLKVLILSAQVPPAAQHSAVAIGPSPGMQWNLAGGFCGAFSVQQAALSAGAWISQDLVRKANIAQPGPHNMHGSANAANCSSDPLGCGWEVMPSNVKWTAEHLLLASDEFDYTQPSPQAAAWKKWAKSHLVQRHAIAFFPMCGGDSHVCYEDSCPNGGHCDHVECMYGIFSNHSLDDLTPYPDDVVLHTSNQDCFPYYRPLRTLEDTTAMEGNCAKAGHHWGENEAYPCIDSNVTYGLAVTGLQVAGVVGRTSLSTNGLTYEPNVRGEQNATLIHPTVHIDGLEPGKHYTVVRYIGTGNLPRAPPFAVPNCSKSVLAASDGTAVWVDGPPFMSDEAAYHFAAESHQVLNY